MVYSYSLPHMVIKSVYTLAFLVLYFMAPLSRKQVCDHVPLIFALKVNYMTQTSMMFLWNYLWIYTTSYHDTLTLRVSYAMVHV